MLAAEPETAPWFSPKLHLVHLLHLASTTTHIPPVLFFFSLPCSHEDELRLPLLLLTCLSSLTHLRMYL